MKINPSKTCWDLVAAGLALFLLAGGCTVTRYQAPPEELPAETVPQKVPADAYLFDAQIRRDGKPTSIRLELYDADTVVAMAGRAYLGKGALKGKLTADSLKIYFPSTNEYLNDAVVHLAAGSKCPVPIGRLDFISLLKNLPEQNQLDSQITLRTISKDDGKASFLLSAAGCVWQMQLQYDTEEDGWHLKRLEFSDGARTHFEAQRREFRRNAGVKASQFEVIIPDDATRLTP